MGTDYYLSFPPPWNAAPQSTGASVGELLKLAPHALPKFDGERAANLAWRSAFIPCVHLTTVDVSFKVMLLRSCMVGSNSRMLEFIRSILCTPEGYREAVRKLESRYGGDENRLLTRYEALLSLPILREGDFRTLETLELRLQTYLMEWSSLSTGDAESLSLFTALMSRLDKRFGRKYVNWVEDRGRDRGLRSLHAWLKEQLEIHRTVEQYYGFSQAELGSDKEAAKGVRPPPASCNERNFKKSFAHVVQDGPTGAAVGNPGEDEIALVDAAAVRGTAGERNKARSGCPVCKAAHKLGHCEAFRSMSPDERKSVLAKDRRCFLCFQKGHLSTRCTLGIKCSICGRRQNTLLHVAEGSRGAALVAAGEDLEGATEHGLLTQANGRVSLRTVVVWISNPLTGRGLRVNALLDDGCTHAALVGKTAALELGLKGEPVWARTEGVGGKVTEYKTVVAPLCVAPLTGGERMLVPAQVMETPAGSYQPVNWKEIAREFPHLGDLPLEAPLGGGVELLIGNRFPGLTLSLEERTPEGYGPVARRTPLGWTVVGPTDPSMQQDGQKAMVAVVPRPRPLPQNPEEEAQWQELYKLEKHRAVLTTDRALVRLVRKMLEIEQPSEVEVLSPREQYAVTKLRGALELVEGRYQAPCLWLPGAGRPRLSYEVALRRLRSLERSKHFENARVKLAYGKVFQQWEEEGFVKVVGKETSEAINYIPHFPIIKQSSSTPVRPVMDCAIELNKYVLPGPNLLNDVVSVLLRFRSGLYSFSGDVKQMFLRIRLAPEDRPFHCFIWRDQQDTEPLVYQYQTHVFGNAGSPCVAVFTVKEHANQYKRRYPAAVETLHKSTLIDDVLDSADTVEEARERLGQVRKILAEAGMRMTKFHANEKAILDGLPQEDISGADLDVAKACHKEGVQAGVKTLGVRYDPGRDCFKFQMLPPLGVEFWTKRKMLKTFPQLFDPLGLLLPFTINARIAFSKANKQTTDWDAPVDPGARWAHWLSDLEKISEVAYPRALKTGLGKRVTLHLFADASAEAYAAAAYVVSEYDAGDTSSVLAMAKAHVAPTKVVTIPRLELLAAELSTQLRQGLLQKIKINVHEVVHWTDSLTVLYWLHNDSARLQTFVYNKIEKIRATTRLEEWRWVPTALNPADFPSRGIRVERLVSNRLWECGPDFLPDKEKWPLPPKPMPTSAVLQEMKKEDQAFITDQVSAGPCKVLHWERCGSWQKCLRVLNHIARWYVRIKGKTGHTVGPTAWKLAEIWALRQAQVDLLKKWKTDASAKAVRALGWQQLRPYLAEDGLIRSRGRLSNVPFLKRDAREPIILDKRHVASQLIIRHIHEVYAHYGGTNYVLSRLHARYWLPGGRAAVSKILRACVDCRRRAAHPARPDQAPLPTFRLPEQGNSWAFSVSAVDCAGPYRVKRGRSHEMYYLLLITCCQIRAVRLEWLSDLSTDAFLLALTRAAARGVNPHTMISDNGGNFEGANKLLRALWNNLPQAELEARRPDIKWRFNPPYASHRGGVFERLIKAAKEALYHAIPEHRALTLEQLITAFAVVEGVLNARPLAYVSSDVSDVQPITPNDFLYGSSSQTLHEDLLSAGQATLAKRWSMLNHLTSDFCVRFAKEIVPYLALRRGSRGPGNPVKVGDLVIFFKPEARRKWPLARVVETFPGKDGHIRTVRLMKPEVRGSGVDYLERKEKTYLRDIKDLAPLFNHTEVSDPVDT